MTGGVLGKEADVSICFKWTEGCAIDSRKVAVNKTQGDEDLSKSLGYFGIRKRLDPGSIKEKETERFGHSLDIWVREQESLKMNPSLTDLSPVTEMRGQELLN